MNVDRFQRAKPLLPLENTWSIHSIFPTSTFDRFMDFNRGFTEFELKLHRDEAHWLGFTEKSTYSP